MFDNDCHTLSRDRCYTVPGIRGVMKLKRELDEAHLFYKAVNCARKVLGLDYETERIYDKIKYLE
jgi:hypothetical protein